MAALRAVAGRPVLRAILDTPFLRARFARGRSTPVEGQVVDEAIAVILALDDLAHDSDHTHRTPAAARVRMRESMAVVDAEPPPGVTTRDEVIAGAIPSRLYIPSDLPAPSPGLVYLHGGGWVTGDLETYDRFCRRFAARARIRVVSVDYRLGPEHRYPAAVDDALAAFRHVAGAAESFGIDPTRLGVGGDSAGGNLSAVVARRTRGEKVTPAATVLIYPAVDSTLSSQSHATFAERYLLTRPNIDWYLGHYLGDVAGQVREPDVSPLLAPDAEGLGPHLITTAHFDPLRDEGEAYAKKLAAAGAKVKLVRCPRLIHGFAVMGGASPAAFAATDALIADAAAALRGELGYG